MTVISYPKAALKSARKAIRPLGLLYFEHIRSRRLLRRNRDKTQRCLEIGPGSNRLIDFETLDIVAARNVDYVANAMRQLPFADKTFDIVYASHVLEHLPWFQTEVILSEWKRILKPSGQLEIWVPDGQLIAEVLLGATNEQPYFDDGWRVENEGDDPFKWVNGRLFYGANPAYPSWHKAVFTGTFLKKLLASVGFVDVRRAEPAEYRGGANHGPINLGVFGIRGAGD